MEIYSIDVISQLEESKFGFGFCENGINSISIVMKVNMTHCQKESFNSISMKFTCPSYCLYCLIAGASNTSQTFCLIHFQRTIGDSLIRYFPSAAGIQSLNTNIIFLPSDTHMTLSPNHGPHIFLRKFCLLFSYGAWFSLWILIYLSYAESTILEVFLHSSLHWQKSLGTIF